ncbi:hypothetical protein PENANT_c015G10155 [Penicillium antarcticum]|uniref:DUF7703 domain-containing protein n=1 Tax=Penicillium antarcticum TaxID=416450 RepID=A0A1V6Q3J8_9EURO|nr:uncharacterized protein N7508_004889 [Penicillium antarcticum]KAJ5305874.1 hypothetical protein N7508_004889 [Penicillium antarcticum]OQD83838.1 hypothetical protein PENANT_c015G10155 [Penicillium antarcticum]
MATNSASDIASSLIHDPTSSSTLRTGVFAALAAVAWYNSIELLVLCFVSFKRYHGTYFWSLLIASASIIPHCLGFVLLFFSTGVTPWLSITLVIISWWGMVTGQSVVLWSRLHLVLQDNRVLWGVLWMICIDAVLFHIPTTVVLYGTVADPEGKFAHGYRIMERIQLVGFCIQELIISSIYVWETIKLLRLRPGGRPQGILLQLLVINIIILCLDVIVVAIEYVGYYAVQVMFKPVAYSIKLKLEYAILGKLVAIARGSYDSQDLPSSAREINEVSSFPSSTDPISNVESGRQRRSHSAPWFWEVRRTSSPLSAEVAQSPGALTYP